MSNRYSILCIYLLLALTTFAVFWQVHSFEFVDYDDTVYVSENKHISAGVNFDNFIRAFTKPHFFMWHPLTTLSNMLDCQLFDLNAGRHHLTNLLFHIANTLLLFCVLKKLTGRIWPSAFVAALFALHPLNVESVAWISERKNVLSCFFWLLTMAAYIRYVKHQRLFNYLLVIFVFALALMSKPTVVTLPFALLLLDYWPLDRLKAEPTDKWRIWLPLIWEKIPLFILSAILSAITVVVQGHAVSTLEGLPLSFRAANIIVSYGKYVAKLFVPVHLAIFYPYPGYRLISWQVVITAVVLIAATICVIRFAKKYKWLAFGWFWYLGTLVPVIGLVQSGGQAMADRYAYVSFIGLFIIIAWGADCLLENWKYQRIVLGILSVVVLSLLSVCTSIQLTYWRNSKTLFEHALKVTSENYIAYDGMARVYGKLGRVQEQIDAYKQAVRIIPNFSDAHYYLAVVLAEQGQFEEAVAHFQKALKNEPTDAGVRCQWGIVLGRQGKFDQAVEQFNQALKIKPDFADAHGNLGFVLLCQHNLDQAVAHLTKAVQLDPNSEKHHYNLAKALIEQGKIAGAVVQFDETLRLKPDWVEPMNTLAWLLATQKDTPVYNPQKAVRIGKHACELTGGKDAGVLDTLAAAYAADGNFPDAVAASEKALNLVKSRKNNQAAEQIQKRLDLYFKNLPYIETNPK